ncbi:MAG: hypothetical protein QXV32_07150 [Conexivisphaerales archaeon]
MQRLGYGGEWSEMKYGYALILLAISTTIIFGFLLATHVVSAQTPSISSPAPANDNVVQNGEFTGQYGAQSGPDTGGVDTGAETLGTELDG